MELEREGEWIRGWPLGSPWDDDAERQWERAGEPDGQPERRSVLGLEHHRVMGPTMTQAIDRMQPRPYQLDGSAFLASHRRALLADEPGVGKTMQAILAVIQVVGPDDRVLVLCPSIARFHWERQCAVWGLDRTVGVMLKGSDRPAASVIVCSYDLAIREPVTDWLCEQPWMVLICDESQYLKSPSAKRSRVVWKRLAHRVEYVWCLSGTPARNHAGDLWTLLHGFGAYPKGYWQFVEEFLVTEQHVFGTTITGTKPHRRHALKALMAPYMLRRRKEEVLAQLPALTYDEWPVEPTEIDYDRWMKDTQLAGPMIKRRAVGFAAQVHTSLQDATSPEAEYQVLANVAAESTMARRYFGLQKAPAIAATVSEELQEGQYKKIVLFAWHRDVLQLLYEQLKAHHPVVLVGGMTARAKDDTLEAFHHKPAHQVLLAQIVAAGVAIDMTAASEVGFAELSYVPSDNAQAVMRVHRYPQTQPVRCRLFMLRQSIDERITRILHRKTADLTQLFLPTQKRGV